MVDITEKWLDGFEQEFDTPVSRALSLLVRPAFIAPKGKTLLWGDWAAIEARVLPWLADTRGSRKVLDVFEGNDNDKGKPDIYMIEGCNMTGDDPQKMWDRYLDGDPVAKNVRQAGKVSVLSLGFGGAKGALKAMAANYGIHYDDAEADKVVHVWRDANKWARRYWDKLFDTAIQCMDDPNTVYPVGKVAYLFDPGYLNGTLFCALPDGRPIAYPRLKWREVEQENPFTGEIETKNVLSFRKQFGWSGLWYGKLAENNTQGTAASLLRHTLRELRSTQKVVGHTHDEIIAEVEDEEVDGYSALMTEKMETNPDWLEGCPLVAEVSKNWYYTKAID